ncbi:MAG TPA: hypothetical protein PL180_07310 [Spirochaetota bacterium]|nr:hypothetical protein [Spirochaetota bacterium]HPL16480.1 hypothetical protein [Spirochaetota bacterium]HQJ72249.1 hypothetical protein [Spirochaetota bacterium]HRS77043.1 hypothetical protein [Spirochaetota bacterium]HRT74829.1 hypothetical protein [Spirochaetota bacterium]
MKQHLTAYFCAALAAVTLQPATAGYSNPVSAEESDRIIKAAFERGIGIYKKYSGVESLRKEVVSEYDPATKKLKSVSELTIKRKDFFYREPEIEVLTYKKDGKDMAPSKFRVMKAMPLYPVFDEKGRDNYLITVAEKIKHDGRQCYRIQVDPRRETSRHFKGSIFVAVNSMEMVGIEGTIAKLDFPIKDFRITVKTKLFNNVPVTQSGEFQVRINVPVFYPDTLIVSTLETIESKLML